jgi:tRNA pseudouridine32 synthase / 23S rRNA pseudouridine746 synthase
MWQLHAGAQRHLHEVRHLRFDLGLFMSSRRTGHQQRREGASAPSSVSARAPVAAVEPPAWLVERILLRDGDLIVLDKPAGLAVHAGPKTPESLEAFLPGLMFGRRDPPQPVHRLDRDTSGCLVLGRTRSAIKRLTGLFAEGKVAKTYWAIVAGGPKQDEGVIDQAIAKRNDPSGWRMVSDRTGLSAVTPYRALARGKTASLLELTPKTGRTHQIRVHCALLGCPVLDDPIYGKGDGRSPHRLHARRIVLPARLEGPDIDVKAPLPPDFAELLASLGLRTPD